MEALEGAEVAVAEGADDDELLGCWSDATTPPLAGGRCTGTKTDRRGEERGGGRCYWDGDHGRDWPSPVAAGRKGAADMVVGDETRVGELILAMSQVNLIVPGCLVLGGGLHVGGCGHGQEVLSRGGGVSQGRGMWLIHMGEGEGHAPGRGRL